jgi:hypothetical protein
MVEIEVRKAEAGEVKTTTLDINEIVNKIGDFANRIKELSSNEKDMTARLDGFNFSINRTPDMYDVTVKLNLTIKPKKSPSATVLPTAKKQGECA